MDQLCRDVLWRIDQMAPQQWCAVSVLLTVACYCFLKGFGSVYRL